MPFVWGDLTIFDVVASDNVQILLDHGVLNFRNYGISRSLWYSLTLLNQNLLI